MLEQKNKEVTMTIERKKLRVYGHGRVSSRGQFIKGTSAKDQKIDIKKECKAKGWEYIGFISDDFISGKTIEDRPAIIKIKELAAANQFDCLMFTDLDRVGRNLRELENFWKLMEEDLGLQLYTDTDYVTLYLNPVPETVTVLGEEAHNPRYYPLALEHNRYLFWGFSGSPESMTEVGKRLYIDVVIWSANSG